MLELLLILAVLVYVVSKLEARRFQQADARFRLEGIALGPKPSPEPRTILRLSIEGTERPFLRSTAFVKGFGVNPQSVQDIRIYAQFGGVEHFPAAMTAALHDLYRRGSALGSDIMQVLFHGRTLRDGEAVYFALLEATPEPRVVAFVDRLRTA